MPTKTAGQAVECAACGEHTVLGPGETAATWQEGHNAEWHAPRRQRRKVGSYAE